MKGYILGRRVRAYVYKRDQYERVVATVWVRKWLVRKDVGEQLLKVGLATVYQASGGAEFGGLEEKYREAEAKAKRKKKGMWSIDPKKYESPREYKTRTAAVEESKQEETKTKTLGLWSRSKDFLVGMIPFRRGMK